MYQTGYYATGYYATQYYLGQVEVASPAGASGVEISDIPGFGQEEEEIFGIIQAFLHTRRDK